MKGLYYEEFASRPYIKSLPDLSPSHHSVVLEVKAAGLCRSDWHGWMGHDPDIKLPHVPGHEFAGTVLKVGKDVQRWKVGDEATTPFVQACGSCMYCLQGDHQVCERQSQAGFTHWGAFAQQVEVHFADVNLAAVPNHLSFEEAAILGCRFGTAYRAVIDQGLLRSEDWMMVLGCGGVGLSAILIGRAIGAKVIALDINLHALQMAVELGADAIVGDLSDESWEQVMALSRGGVSLIIDAVGDTRLLPRSLRFMRRRAKYLQVGLIPNQKVPLPMEMIVAREIQIIGSHGIQSTKYQEMFAFIENHHLDVSRMIRHRHDLSSAIDHLTTMHLNQHAGVDVITDFL